MLAMADAIATPPSTDPSRDGNITDTAIARTINAEALKNDRPVNRTS
jgi:hypothetical protein